MVRFIDELRHPEKKCARVGHKEITEYLRGKCTPRQWEKWGNGGWSFRTVAIRFRETRKSCWRCKEHFGSEYKFVSSYQEISMPSDMMEEFEEKGFLYDAD